METKLSYLKNRAISLLIVIACFGYYPREAQQEAPTVFALIAILVYGINTLILDLLLIYKRIKNKDDEKNN